ncbi:biotin transporter BioY [Clostridium sp. MSJ-11]|uniref:Biotin transporter n=1 Tax=Clostridium mobile TaxID=2841512 RepID=A0ABS6EJ18_9CLOT|nr:biotin transporter BioY [Clostridium mobile]MBU5484777.1 biotin transporter BioY [Clostridium mobile]
MKISTKNIITISLFTALTAIGAFIKIPIAPAPITIQFLFTALAGILLGSKYGSLSQLMYLLIGLFGVPIFTEGGGFNYIFKPSFGYIIGFVFASYVIGKIVEGKGNISFKKIFLACIAGLFVMYLVGVPYLYFILKYVSGVNITINKALNMGLIVFLPGDILKCIVTALLGERILKHRFYLKA